MIRSQLSPLTWIFGVTVLLLNGCGVTEQIKRNYEEASESYTAPESLDGNVDSTGLLLVDAVMKKALNTMPLSGVAIANIENYDREILSGSFKTGGFLSSMSGVVVFPNLEPGRYKIVKIRTENVNMWETTFMPNTVQFEVDVNPGIPTYVGQIEVRHPMGSTDRIINVNYDEKREMQSWQMTQDKYADSEWTVAIETLIRDMH